MTLLSILEIVGTVGAAIGICFGIISWMSAVYEKGKSVLDSITQTQTIVSNIKANHLTHIEQDISTLKSSLEELVSLTRDIRDGTLKLVDRER